MHKQISVASQLRLNRLSSTISIANLIVREGQPRGGRRSPIDKSSRDIARGVVGRALGLRFSLVRLLEELEGKRGRPANYHRPAETASCIRLGLHEWPIFRYFEDRTATARDSIADIWRLELVGHG